MYPRKFIPRNLPYRIFKK